MIQVGITVRRDQRAYHLDKIIIVIARLEEQDNTAKYVNIQLFKKQIFSNFTVKTKLFIFLLDEQLSDVKLKGIRSYIALIADGLHQHQSCIDLEVRPLSNQGLLLYSGKKDNSGFWSLSLQGGVLELRVSPGIIRECC